MSKYLLGAILVGGGALFLASRRKPVQDKLGLPGEVAGRVMLPIVEAENAISFKEERIRELDARIFQLQTDAHRLRGRQQVLGQRDQERLTARLAQKRELLQDVARLRAHIDKIRPRTKREQLESVEEELRTLRNKRWPYLHSLAACPVNKAKVNEFRLFHDRWIRASYRIGQMTLHRNPPKETVAKVRAVQQAYREKRDAKEIEIRALPQRIQLQKLDTRIAALSRTATQLRRELRRSPVTDCMRRWASKGPAITARANAISAEFGRLPRLSCSGIWWPLYLPGRTRELFVGSPHIVRRRQEHSRRQALAEEYQSIRRLGKEKVEMLKAIQRYDRVKAARAAFDRRKTFCMHTSMEHGQKMFDAHRHLAVARYGRRIRRPRAFIRSLLREERW